MASFWGNNPIIDLEIAQADPREQEFKKCERTVSNNREHTYAFTVQHRVSNGGQAGTIEELAHKTVSGGVSYYAVKVDKAQRGSVSASSREPLIKSRLAAWHTTRLHLFRHSTQLSFANREIGCTQ